MDDDIQEPRTGECERCGKEKQLYFSEEYWQYLCSDCEYILTRQQMYSDMENYCQKCGHFAEILEKGKCPKCFELDGYTL
jgi:ssDNA-binding Zn-finger/Zn-ribbon topoisomerase 1